jgi:murein DD-endopeptidase MepM/ murein hydrolase activator NlpD
LDDLEGIVSNPYRPPRPGSDDPHQAVDLAERMDGSGMALAGMAVQALLPGRVVLAQADRFPYGNTVIVETPLDAIPQPLWETLPSIAPLWTPNPALNCPEVPQPDAQSPQRSVYVLYAHLQDPPQVQVGESLLCGQVIGAIGQTGNALAPHLHLEMRAGPAGWQTAALAHYTNSASLEEMGQYCTWRVSGIFQHLDPLQWLEKISAPSPGF